MMIAPAIVNAGTPVQLSYVPSSWNDGVVVLVCGGMVGTAWWVSENYLVTAAHVVGSQATCEAVKGDWTGQATVVDVNTTTDLAVLMVGDPPSHYTFPIRPGVSLGETAYVIGYPAAIWELLGTAQAVSENPRVLRFTVPWVGDAGGVELVEIGYTQPGNSGGPVVDNDGRVIGVVSFALPPNNNTDMWLYYATSSKELIPLLESNNIKYSIDIIDTPELDDTVTYAALGGAIAGAVAAGGFLFILARGGGRR